GEVRSARPAGHPRGARNPCVIRGRALGRVYSTDRGFSMLPLGAAYPTNSNYFAIRCAQAGLVAREGSAPDSWMRRSNPRSLRILPDLATNFTRSGSN